MLKERTKKHILFYRTRYRNNSLWNPNNEGMYQGTDRNKEITCRIHGQFMSQTVGEILPAHKDTQNVDNMIIKINIVAQFRLS